MKIRNKDLAIYLGFKLNKIGDEYSPLELSNLKELELNHFNSFNEYVDVDIEILNYTSNLESLTLKNFEITDEIIDAIKKYERLKLLSINHCIADFEKIAQIDVDYLSITDNALLRTDYFKDKNYKGLIVTDSDLIDIDNITHMKDLEFLHISNSNVVNYEKIENLKNLSTLHFDETNISNISFLLKLPNIKTVSLDKELYMKNIDIVNKLKEKDVLFIEKGYLPILDVEDKEMVK